MSLTVNATESYLEIGSYGAEVIHVQEMLKQLSYDLTVDGIYGVETAARAFQTDNGLYPDGIAGPITIQALMNFSSESDPVPVPEPNPEPSPDPIPVPDELNRFGMDGRSEADRLAKTKLDQVGWDL